MSPESLAKRRLTIEATRNRMAYEYPSVVAEWRSQGRELSRLHETPPVNYWSKRGLSTKKQKQKPMTKATKFIIDEVLLNEDLIGEILHSCGYNNTTTMLNLLATNKHYYENYRKIMYRTPGFHNSTRIWHGNMLVFCPINHHYIENTMKGFTVGGKYECPEDFIKVISAIDNGLIDITTLGLKLKRDWREKYEVYVKGEKVALDDKETEEECLIRFSQQCAELREYMKNMKIMEPFGLRVSHPREESIIMGSDSFFYFDFDDDE